MATATAASTTRAHAPESIRAAIGRHAATFKDVIRWAVNRATRRRQDEYSREVAKKVLSSNKSAAVEHVVSLVVDAAQRGSLEDAEAIGNHLVAIARSEHASVNGTGPQLSVAEAHIAEEVAEGDVEICETRMARDPSTSNLLAFLAASATHARTRRELDAAVRRDLAKRSG